MEQPHRRERRRRRISALGRPRGAQGSATRDPVTGLMNAAAFTAVAGHALRRCAGLGEPSGLLCLSLAGREGEDEVSRAGRLRQAARALQEATRGEDVLGRTGALELCAFLPGIEQEAVGLVSERLEVAGATVGWAHASRPGALGPELAALLAAARGEGSWGSSSPGAGRYS